MIINGNSLEELKKFPDNYFHSVVTDPPYGLSFMGKKWDYDVPSVELWQEVFRVLKEGGYLLSFAGTRTQHRMAVNIEDAGFEIRDMIAWVYGSGFPKSHNIGKAIDKLQGNEREEFEHTFPDGSKPRKTAGHFDIGNFTQRDTKYTKGTSEWEGWGTALKPALEPITMARKPFKTSVAENVLKNGVGGINIDGCRVETEENLSSNNTTKKFMGSNNNRDSDGERIEYKQNPQGRFPANFIHDGSDEVKDLFPINNTKGSAIRNNHKNPYGSERTWSVSETPAQETVGYADKGSASRFFYCAKASKKDRNEGLEDFEDNPSKKIQQAVNYKCNKCNKHKGSGSPCICIDPDFIIKKYENRTAKNFHPTVKPTDLMRYLVRLVTPKNGIVLDCFMGSGSTGKACALEGFEFVGIDLDKDYCKIAKARIDKAIEDKKQAEAQQELF